MDTLTEDTDRALLQERIVLFARTILVLFGLIFVGALVAFQALPDIAPKNARVVHAIVGIGLAGLAVIWLIARSRRQSLARLRLLDACIMFSGGTMMAAGTYIGAARATDIYIPFTMAILFLFARVFSVPGSTRRMLGLALLVMVPVGTANLAVGFRSPELLDGIPIAGWVGGGALLCGAPVALATFGNSVIFGLRSEIKEAKRYGQYTLEHKLGEGGMGVVFKARHALLRRPTAIKLLPPTKASPEDIARFEREVQLTSELTHPNTIAIYDYGRSTDGVFYYVMEYLDGIDLESLVEREGALPAERVANIIVQIASALDEAHARGIIHRDIKPANVLLCRRGQVADFVKVVDFGLVKEIAREATVTAPGAIAGTPAYLAPEAVTDPDAIGPASDLYALGAVAYFLLTGKMVFEGKTVIAIVNDHLSTTPVPPSKRTDRTIPPELEAIVLQCLAKKPSSRPASARALADSIRALSLDSFDAEAWWSTFERGAPKEGAAVEVATTIAVLPR